MNKEAALGNEEQNQKRMIGKEIPWQSIAQEVFRVQHFTPYANVEGEKVVPPARPLPYASLTIEDHRSSELIEMPVLHRIDFRNLWDIFNRNILGGGDCLYVSYAPLEASEYRSFLLNTTIRLFGNIMPQLGLITAPEGIEMMGQNGKISPEWSQANTMLWCPDAHIDNDSTALDNYRESGLFPISKSAPAIK